MTAFDFRDLTGSSANETDAGFATNFALSSDLGGIRFTLSVTDPAPVNYFLGLNGSVGMSSGNSADGTDIFTLTAFQTATPSLKGFTGHGTGSVVSFDYFLLFGTAEVTFHGTKADAVTTLRSAAGSSGKAMATTATTGTIGKITFTFSGVQDGLGLTALAADIACFAAGTRIATPDGPRAVETLRPGARLTTADGGVTHVAWLGRQRVDTSLTHPAKVNPVRIAAGALGGGLPERDLLVSADHALFLDGYLANAGCLVNGTTIRQERQMPLDGFTYFHVETEGGHELILAEGVAAESFIDYAGRGSFVNGDERAAAPAIEEMRLPRIPAARLVPQTVRARLGSRTIGKAA